MLAESTGSKSWETSSPGSIFLRVYGLPLTKPPNGEGCLVTFLLDSSSSFMSAESFLLPDTMAGAVSTFSLHSNPMSGFLETEIPHQVMKNPPSYITCV